jgi:Zn-dependent protease
MSADDLRPDEQQPPLDVAPDEAASPPAFDALTSAVLAELDREPEQRTWVQSLTLLGVSLAIFALTGFFNNEPSRLALLIGVLLFHELGHYVGMRMFNYQDVRMFFIPLFGAAVAGRQRSVQGYKEAIVLLLGPLPGIFLGAVLGVVAMARNNELLHSAAMLLVVLNGFNLLPFMPLDGGRFLHLVLFSRQPYLEAVFRVVTGGLLALCGWGLSSWMLGLVGVFIIFGTPAVFRLSRLAWLLRGPLRTGEEMDLTARIPHEYAVPLIERIRASFPQTTQPKQLANMVRQVWERIHLRPPGLVASLLLLLIYAGGFLAAPVIALALSIPIPVAVTREDANGKPVRVREVRVWGRVQQWTEVDANGIPEGRHVEFHANKKVKTEGAYREGIPHGDWKNYGENGRLESVSRFRGGKMIQMPPVGQDGAAPQ